MFQTHIYWCSPVTVVIQQDDFLSIYEQTHTKQTLAHLFMIVLVLMVATLFHKLQFHQLISYNLFSIFIIFYWIYILLQTFVTLPFNAHNTHTFSEPPSRVSLCENIAKSSLKPSIIWLVSGTRISTMLAALHEDVNCCHLYKLLSSKLITSTIKWSTDKSYEICPHSVSIWSAPRYVV
jgi:hypothetical protein